MTLRPYLERDGITLYHGDAREILPQLEELDACITDPPWGADVHEGARRLAGDRTGRFEIEKLIKFDSVTAEELRDFFALVRVRRWLVATVDWRHIVKLEEEPPAGFNFIRFGVWVKPGSAPQFSGDRPACGWEGIGIWHAAGRGGRMRWNGGGRPATWNIPTLTARGGLHPTQKPHALLAEFVSLFTDPGETILDPFAGSGTSLIVARDLGRRAVGIEISEEYCELAARRLDQQLLPFAECSP